MVCLPFLLASTGLAHGTDRGSTGPAKNTPAPPAQQAPSLFLRAASVDTSTPVPGLDAACGKPGHVVIQLDGPITPARAASLAAAGITLGDYLPADAYIATLSNADAKAVATLNFIRWWGPYQTAWKTDTDAGARKMLTPERQALAEQGLRVLTVVLFDGEPALSQAQAIDFLRALPQAVIHHSETIAGNLEITATCRAADIAALASLAQVQFIEEAPEITLRNSTDRWIVQSNVSNSTPVYDRGIHGENQVLGLLDSALDANHCSFRDASNPIGPTHRKILAYNATQSAASHGTHVAGTAIGDNNVNDDTRGVAYAGKVVYGPIPSFTESAVSTALNLHHSQGARVHTNSWGDDSTTSYNGLCRGFDNFQYLNEDSFVCLAVSNGSAVTNPDNAKNLLAVGASQDSPNQGSHCYGGVGPTSDSRRKPEIYAPGCGTISASYNTTCSTTALSGTSMATPAIAGSAMLVRQYYMSGFFPGGVAGSGPSITPSAALIKATLLNSATDMTGIAGYPSNLEGFGRVLLDDALYFSGDARKLIAADVRNADGLVTSAIAPSTVNVLTNTQTLRFTLAYTEPPAAAGSAQATVNDLDLVVSAPDGSTYLGNVFSGGVSVTGGTRDPRNNVEQVIVPTPTPGVWTVQVRGASVAVGTQGYSLVVTGDVVPPSTGLVVSIAGSPPSLAAPDAPIIVNAVIDPFSDTLVGGSPTVFYRYVAGPWFSKPLNFLSGTSYQAVLPGARCGETPQFYIAAAGQSSGIRTAPVGGAAAPYSLSVGSLQPSTLLTENFAAGLPAGWSATGLWHASSACDATPACEAAPWFAYNQDSTCTYNTGAATAGSLSMPSITVPAVGSLGQVSLVYCSSAQTEAAATYDTRKVFFGTNLIDEAPQGNWTTRTINLSAFAGQSGVFRFEFDSRDAINNAFRGWQIDSIRINTTQLACTTSCSADFDRSGVIDPADIAAYVNAWLASLTNASVTGDFDRNGTTEPADIAAFVNSWLNQLQNGC